MDITKERPTNIQPLHPGDVIGVYTPLTVEELIPPVPPITIEPTDIKCHFDIGYAINYYTLSYEGHEVRVDIDQLFKLGILKRVDNE